MCSSTWNVDGPSRDGDRDVLVADWVAADTQKPRPLDQPVPEALGLQPVLEGSVADSAAALVVEVGFAEREADSAEVGTARAEAASVIKVEVASVAAAMAVQQTATSVDSRPQTPRRVLGEAEEVVDSGRVGMVVPALLVPVMVLRTVRQTTAVGMVTHEAAAHMMTGHLPTAAAEGTVIVEMAALGEAVAAIGSR